MLAALAPTLAEAVSAAAAKAYVILDGILLPIDRIAADRPLSSGKHKKHGMNGHVLTDPFGHLLLASPARRRHHAPAPPPQATPQHHPHDQRRPGRPPSPRPGPRWNLDTSGGWTGRRNRKTVRRATQHNAHVDFLIDSARVEDAPAVARAFLSAWLQTYPNQDAGIDQAWIRAHRGNMITSEGIAQWREFIEQAERQPADRFCRVVRHRDEIVGMLCGRREEAISLGPMYLLQQAQGRGIGRELMAAFLAWADDAPIRLWVTTYNERAISFYERYGFEDTGERHLWRDRLPNLRMIKRTPQDNEAGFSERRHPDT